MNKKIYIHVFFVICITMITVSTVLHIDGSQKLDMNNYFIKNEMVQENINLQYVLNEQIMYYQNTRDRLQDIESSLGIKPYEEMARIDFNSVMDYLKLSTAQKNKILELLPNGNVVKSSKGVSDRFGVRVHPVSNIRLFHKGIDFRVDLKTPIYAPADGVVEFVGTMGGFGSLVIINHGFGFKTYYAHLDIKPVVKYSQFVKKGTHIANSGNTGLSTGPHLHYEVRYLGNYLNPENFINWNTDNFYTIFYKEKKVPWNNVINSVLYQAIQN